MKRTIRSVALVVVAMLFVVCANPVHAQDALAPVESAPAEQGAAQGEENIAIVVSVKGKVSYAVGGGAARLPAKVAQVLPEGSVVYTSLRSAVQIRIGDTQVFTIDRLAKVALNEMRKFSEADRTTMDVDMGRVLFNVTSTEFANDVTIRAPDATLAIRGTNGGIEVTPGQPTRGFGGEFNQGRIDLFFDEGPTTTITDDSEADSEEPVPASKRNKDRKIETSDENSIEDDENEATDRSPGSSNSITRETVEEVRAEVPEDEQIIDPNDPFNPGNNLDIDPDLTPTPPPPGDGDGDMMPPDEMPDDMDDMMPPDEMPDDMMPPDEVPDDMMMGGDDDMMMDDDDDDMMMEEEDPFVIPNALAAVTENGGEFVGVGNIGDDIDGPVFPLSAFTILPLPENAPSGGLTLRDLPNGDVEILYLAGGTQGVNGNDTAINNLYSTVVTPGLDPGPFGLIGAVEFDFQQTTGMSGAGANPVLSDLTAFDDAATGANQELYAIRAFFDEGGMGSNVIESAIVRLDESSATPVAVEEMNLLVPLEGLGAHSDFGLFAAGFQSGNSTGNQFSDLVVYQVDPRNSYVINSWWGDNGDFNTDSFTEIEAGFDTSNMSNFDRIGGVAAEFDGIVNIVGFANVDADGNATNPIILSFDSLAGGVNELGTTGTAGSPIGIASFEEGVGEAFAPLTLSNPEPIDLDIAGINVAFANIAYSEEALQSGALESTFTQQFIETAVDPVFCGIDSLISSIPSQLLINANTTQGIGRTAYQLRSGLPGTHPCISEFQLQQGQQIESLDLQ